MIASTDYNIDQKLIKVNFVCQQIKDTNIWEFLQGNMTPSCLWVSLTINKFYDKIVGFKIV